MMNTINDSILVFEYFTASGEKDKCIISEAEALLFALIDDLSDYSLDVVVNKSYENIISEYNNVNPILIDTDIISWLEDNASNFNRAIFISAENENNLYNITRILEENDVSIFTSSSEACLIASDKSLTYETILNKVPQPRTSIFKIDSNGYWKKSIVNLHEKWQSKNPSNPLKLIIKPLMGVDCENIVIINDINDLSDDLEEIFPPKSRIIVQEYVDGEDISVSLICNDGKATPISLNKQFVKLENNKGTYIGGMLPFESELKDKAFKIAKKACESIRGLNGFVGVDLLLSNGDNIHPMYLLEVNSRFTTPYVGLKKIANFNIVKTIIERNIEEVDISLNGKVQFKKQGDNLEIRRI